MSQPCDFVDLELPEMPGLCLAIKTADDGNRAPWLMAQPQGATIYAAAWRDRGGKVHDWYELWIQDSASWVLQSEDPLMTLKNPALDLHWAKLLEGMEQSAPGSVLHMGFESSAPEPIWLDPMTCQRWRPEHNWTLCQDDAYLTSERLAPYSTSLHRYLWTGAGAEGVAVPVTPGAPEGRRTSSADEVFGDAIPINPYCGLMLLRRASPMLLDDFSDLISGIENGAHPQDCLRIPPSGIHANLLERAGLGKGQTGFFFARGHPVGHLGEVLHLKLSLLRGALGAVRSTVERTATPFLGVRSDAFGVTLADFSESLPYLWSHRVDSLAPPMSVRTELGDVREPCFLPTKDCGRSIYDGLRASEQIRGQGRVRIRAVTPPDDDGLVVVEGTLITDESLNPGRLDLLGIEWLTKSSGRLRLFAKMDGQADASSGEYRFASLQTRLPDELAVRLQSGDSTLSSDRVAFHLLPRLGTPCDLYSFGVLALRILVAGPGAPLSAALDDLLAMARLYGQRFSQGNWTTGTGSLNEFVKTGEGGAWSEKLGPHRLVGGRIEPSEAFREIPAQMWWQVIEFVARLFPGESLGSFCKDYDDFSPRALHDVFTEPLASLDTLLVATRDLMFGNPKVNQDLLGLIRGFSKR